MKSKYNMYYGATSETLEKAKMLRKSETIAEKLLWVYLSSNKIDGYKFRRQHAVSQFIVDFYCHELQLLIEVDGEIHNVPENKEYDENRTVALENLGLRVIRFTNQEIKNDIEGVLKEIQKAIITFKDKGFGDESSGYTEV
jgi:very-short-patch-repair endonuclease